MKRNAKLIFSIGVIATALTGCQSHQAKIDALQREHDRISEQYKRDCGDQYLKAQPQFSQKCVDEAKQMDDIYKRLQEERAKQ
jgi:uncharacterized protein YukE